MLLIDMKILFSKNLLSNSSPIIKALKFHEIFRTWFNFCITGTCLAKNPEIWRSDDFPFLYLDIIAQLCVNWQIRNDIPKSVKMNRKTSFVTVDMPKIAHVSNKLVHSTYTFSVIIIELSKCMIRFLWNLDERKEW